MALTFRYKSPETNHAIKAPLIPITISDSKRSIGTAALVDSGADVSMISLDWAEILELDLHKTPTEAVGIGGTVRTIDTVARIKVEKGRERYDFTIPVAVLLPSENGTETDDMPIILGRKGFFDKFVISFHEAREKVTLKRVQ